MITERSCLFVWLLIFLAGCQPAATVSSTQEASPKAASVTAAQAVPSLSPTPPVVNTPALTPTATAIPDQLACHLIKDDVNFVLSFSSNTFELPDLAKLRWIEAAAQGGGSFRALEGWNGTPINRPRLSPDGRWLAVEATTRVNPDSMLPDYDTALLVLDLQQSGHWQAAGSQPGSPWYQWLADGRLLWIDQGQVFAARGDGSQKAALQAPEPISRVWINRQGQALASGKHFWQVDLAIDHWEPVPRVTDVQDFSFSLDQTYGIAAVGLDEPYDTERFYFPPAGGTVCVSEAWKVPSAPGGKAQRFAQSKNAQHCWEKGSALAPSQIRANPRYWDTHSLAGKQGDRVAFLLDESTGELVRADAVFGAGKILDFYPRLSPDGQWLYMETAPGRAVARVDKSEEIFPLKLEDYEQILGWLPDSRGLISFAKEADALRLRVHRVPPGEVIELAPVPPGWAIVRLNGAWIEMRHQKRGSLKEPVELLLYNFQGQPVGQAVFPLDMLNGPTLYSLGAGSALLTGVQGQWEDEYRACHYRTYIIQWNIAAPR